MAPIRTSDPFPRRGDVHMVRLDKKRPAIIISTEALNRYALDVCVVPVTGVEHRKFSLRVPISAGEAGLRSNSWAKCDQVTTIEKSLLLYPAIGSLSPATLRKVEESIKLALELIDDNPA